MPFPKSNSTQIPNELIDRYLPEMTSTELKVVLVIARHTYGCQCEQARLSLSDLVRMTGLAENTIIAALRSAEARGLVEKHSEPRKTATYRISLDQTTSKFEVDAQQTTSKFEVDEPQTTSKIEADSANLPQNLRQIFENEGVLINPIKQDSIALTEDHINLINLKDSSLSKNSNSQKPKSEFVKAMEHLEQTFASARGCAPPPWDKDPRMCNRRWRTPLAHIYRYLGNDLGKTDRLVRAAVAHMRKNNLTFDAPDQIVKVAMSLAIDFENGVEQQIPETIEDVARRMAAQYQRHIDIKQKLGFDEDQPI